MNITDIVDDNSSLCNCTDDDNNNMILEISPILIIIVSIIPCFISILCMITVMLYTTIKTFFKK